MMQGPGFPLLCCLCSQVSTLQTGAKYVGYSSLLLLDVSSNLELMGCCSTIASANGRVKDSFWLKKKTTTKGKSALLFQNAAWSYVGRSQKGGLGGYLEQGWDVLLPLLHPKWKSLGCNGFIVARITGSEWLMNCSYLNKNNTFSFLPPLPGFMTLKGFVTSHEPWENKPWWIPIRRDSSEGMCPLLPAPWKTTVLARSGRGAIHSGTISQITLQKMDLLTLKWAPWGFCVPFMCQVSSGECAGWPTCSAMGAQHSGAGT